LYRLFDGEDGREQVSIPIFLDDNGQKHFFGRELCGGNKKPRRKNLKFPEEERLGARMSKL
jgi:hypothetical protein